MLNVDTPVPYQLGELIRSIDDVMGKLDRPENSAPYLRLKARLQALQADQRFAFMFPGLAVRDNMAAILAQFFRVPVAGKPATIIDLSGVPSEIVNVVVSVLARMTFDFALWSERETPILLVCEEAHRYMPQDSGLGFEPTKRALARIAKEGRKYGVSLCLVSQRPSELDPSILSQCNTIFAMRLTNQRDQDFVRGALSETSIGLMDFLPALRNAEAIAVGEGVSVPMRVYLDQLPEAFRPCSGTVPFSTAWQDDRASDLDEIVARWRRQRR
jgi:DNA helicase HerA-like ATPase